MKNLRKYYKKRNKKFTNDIMHYIVCELFIVGI